MSKFFRFLPGIYTVVDGKPAYPNGVRVEMNARRALALLADISRQLADGKDTVEVVFIGQLVEDDDQGE